MTEGRQQLVLRPSKWKLGMPVTCLRNVPNNLHWVIGCTPQGEIFCLDPNHEGFETLVVEENQQTYCLDISPDGNELATAGKDTEIRLYALQSGHHLSGFEPPEDKVKPRKRSMRHSKSKSANTEIFQQLSFQLAVVLRCVQLKLKLRDVNSIFLVDEHINLWIDQQNPINHQIQIVNACLWFPLSIPIPSPKMACSSHIYLAIIQLDQQITSLTDIL